MQDLLKTILASNCPKLGAVLHVGAGACSEMAQFLSFNPDKVMLVEADPERAASLAATMRGVRGVEVVNAAVSPTGAKAVLWLVNNPRESSVHRPENLLTRYPNLRVTRSVGVPALALAELVERLAVDAEAENLLVIELQGAELSVLAATAPEVLWKFSWVAVRASAEVLYQDGARLEDVNAFLSKCGFQAATPLESDSRSPFQDILYHRDIRELQLYELRRELARQRSENADLTHSLEEQSQLCEEWRAELAEANRERLEQAQSIKALQAENQAVVERTSSLGLQLEETSEALRQKSRLAEQRHAEMERLARERDERLDQAASLRREKASLEERVEALARVAEERRNEIERLAREQSEHAQRTAVLHRDKTALAERIAALDGQLAASARAAQDQVRLAEEHRAEIERLTREQGARGEQMAALQSRLVSLQSQLAASVESDEAQRRLAEERRGEVERLSGEQRAHLEQAAALQQRITTLETQLSISVKAHEDQSRLAEERRGEGERLAGERDKLAAHIEKLEGDRSELDHRQKLLDEEVVKAEAQIDLIKDVLLREKAL